jgi:hypothetical protein
MSLSGPATERIVRLLRDRTDRSREPLPQSAGSSETRETLFQEKADATMNCRPRFAIRTKSEVLADGFLPVLAEGPVEKKVCKAFNFVTDHPKPS